jgi:hypothetical protein
MYIQQVELTRGVGRDFVKALTEISVKEEHEQGDILFRREEPANHAFLQKLLKKDPTNRLIFFQRLAGMLGKRLMESYARYEKLFRGETLIYDNVRNE